MCETYGGRCIDVLSEHDALGLDNKEVDELMNISNIGVEGLLGHRVVSSRTELRGETVGEERLAQDLSQDSNTQSYPCQLEPVPQDVEIASSEDEEDGRDEGDGGGPRMLP